MIFPAHAAPAASDAHIVHSGVNCHSNCALFVYISKRELQFEMAPTIPPIICFDETVDKRTVESEKSIAPSVSTLRKRFGKT